MKLSVILFLIILSFSNSVLSCEITSDFKIQDYGGYNDINPKTQKIELVRGFVDNLSAPTPRLVKLFFKEIKSCDLDKIKITAEVLMAANEIGDEDNHGNHAIPKESKWLKLKEKTFKVRRSDGQLEIGPIKMGEIYDTAPKGQWYWKFKLVINNQEFVIPSLVIH